MSPHAILQRATRTDQPLVWLAPVVVAVCVFVCSEKVLVTLMGAALATVLFVILMNRPGPAVIALVVFLPLQLVGFGLLLGLHVPSGVLRAGGALPELIALAILAAGLREIRDSGRRLEALDFALLAYVAVVTAYLVVPHLFSSQAPTQWSPRILAWRSDAGYPLVFFGARHAPIPPRYKDRFMQVILALGGMVAVLGLYQRLAPASWSNFILTTAHVPLYEFKVLGLPPDVIAQNLGYLYNINPLRVSSIFTSPFDMSDFLVLVIAVCAVRISSNRRSWVNYAVLAASVACIFFSRSRADGVAAVAILVLVALPSSRTPVEGRLRLIGVLVVGALLIVPSLGGTRFVGAQGGSGSSKAHISAFQDGVEVMKLYPLGLGLGAQPSTANRFITTLKVTDISENSVLQVGDELGVQALVTWLAMVGLVLWGLRRRASDGDLFATCMAVGLLGVLIAGLYHHVFLLLPVPWTLWVGAGLALCANRGPVAEEVLDRAVTDVSSPGVR